MKKRAFSLMEMIAVLIIMGIIATIAIPTYQNFIEDSRARVCETNLRALKTALDIYAMDHDTMPGSLGELPQEYINKAYAQVMQCKDSWKTKLAYSILEWDAKGIAYAAEGNLLYKLAKGNIKLITCPKAAYSPYDSGGGFISMPSYGMNGLIAAVISSFFRNLPAATPLIGDCDAVSFINLAGLTKRHLHVFSGQQYSISISKDGTITHY